MASGGSSSSSVAWSGWAPRPARPASSGPRAARRRRSALGRWSIDFYRGQSAAYGTDSGFRELGYLILAATEDDERLGRERVAMQHEAGLTDVRWLTAAEAAATVPGLGRDRPSRRQLSRGRRPHRPAAQRPCVLAGDAASRRGAPGTHGLHRVCASSPDGGRVVGVDTSAGPIDTERVLLTGGPTLSAVGEVAGLRIPAGAARHTVAVLESDPAYAVERLPMVFDLGAGLYWRLEEGGLLFGWSDPDEAPGEARAVDLDAYERYRAKLAGYLPHTRDLGLRRLWAATIDYTPDHLPILGPAVRPDGSRHRRGHDRLGGRARDDVGPGGGPGRRGPRRPWRHLDRRRRATWVWTGSTREGRSRLPTDPIALPFPVTVTS